MEKRNNALAMHVIHKIKYTIKVTIAYAMYYSGILWIIKHWKLNNNAVVLMYHRVLPAEVREESFSYSGIIVSPETFETHIQFLEKHFNIVNCNQFTDHITENKPFKNNTCLITFDDGWADNYHHAYPILAKYQTPATIFIPVDYISSNNLFWQESMGHTIYQLLRSSHSAATQAIASLGLTELSSLPEAQQKERIMDFVRVQKKRSYDEIDTLQHKLNKALEGQSISQQSDRYLNWPQINEMANNGVTFDSHACSHKILTRLSQHEISEELSRAKHVIEEKTYRKVLTIAYPNGDCDNTVESIANACEYKVGFTTRCGTANHNSSAFTINRVNIKDATTRNRPMFLATLLGIF